MYKNRAIFSGRLSEIFGEDAVMIDQFSRTLGYKRIATETFETLTEDDRLVFEAYADGVNDFVKNVDLMGQGSARLLPPEFYTFGIAEVELWHPIDSLSSLLLIGFHLTSDWTQDLIREIYKQEGLQNFADEMVPFAMVNSHLTNSVLSDDDLKRMDKWSDETLSEQYTKNKDLLK